MTNAKSYTWSTAEASLVACLSSPVLLAAAHHDRQTGAVHTHPDRQRAGYKYPAPADHAARASKDAQGKSRASTWTRNHREVIALFAPIAQAFKDGSYSTPLMKQSLVPKADPTKFRVINRPAVLHATVQAVVLEHIETLIDPKLSPYQHGYRPTSVDGQKVTLKDLSGHARGSTKAVAMRLKRWVGSGYDYVVEADLKDAFDHVNKDKLQQRLVAFGASDKLAALVINLLGDQADCKGQVVKVNGIPQGTVLSPLLFNVVTSEIHEQMQGSSGRVVSYADNFWLCAKSEQELKAMISRFAEVISQLGFTAKFKPTWSAASGQPLPILVGKGNGGFELHVTAGSNKLRVVGSKSSTTRSLHQSNRRVGGEAGTVGTPTESDATGPTGPNSTQVSGTGSNGDAGVDIKAIGLEADQAGDGDTGYVPVDAVQEENDTVKMNTPSAHKHRLVRLTARVRGVDVRLSGVAEELPAKESTRYADQDLARSTSNDPVRPDQQPDLGMASEPPKVEVASPHASSKPSKPKAGVGEALAEHPLPLTVQEAQAFALSLRTLVRSQKQPADGPSDDDTTAQTGSGHKAPKPKDSTASNGKEASNQPAVDQPLRLVAPDDVKSVPHHLLRQVWQQVSASVVAAGYREVMVALPLHGPLLAIPDVFGSTSKAGDSGDAHWNLAACDVEDGQRFLLTLTRRKDPKEKRLLSKLHETGVHLTAFTVTKGQRFGTTVFGLINYPDQQVRGHYEIGPTLANPSSALAEGLAHWLARHPTDLPVTVWLYDNLVRSAVRGHYGNADATRYEGVGVPDMHDALLRWQRTAKACKGGLRTTRAKRGGAVAKRIAALVMAHVGLRLSRSVLAPIDVELAGTP